MPAVAHRKTDAGWRSSRIADEPDRLRSSVDLGI